MSDDPSSRLRTQETLEAAGIIVVSANPDGVVSAAESMFAFDTVGKSLYINVNGATDWEELSTGSGGAVTASNVGVGTGDVFKQKLIDNLQFRTLLQGTNIIIGTGTDEITISSSDENVSVTASDTTPGHLDNKLSIQPTDPGLVKTILNPGANEVMELDFSSVVKGLTILTLNTSFNSPFSQSREISFHSNDFDTTDGGGGGTYLVEVDASIARTVQLHDAVTLATSLNSNLLNIAGQQLSLDNQTGNTVFASPSGGGNGAPAFRAIIAADLPAGTIIGEPANDGWLYGRKGDGTWDGTDAGFEGPIGIGTQTPAVMLDVVLGNSFGTIGEIRSADITTDLQDKWNIYSLRHYDNSEQSLSVIVGYSAAAFSQVRIGGGSVNNNAATQLLFYTGATNTTSNGTARMTIDSVGNVGIGTTTPAYQLTVKHPTSHAQVGIDSSGSGVPIINFLRSGTLHWHMSLNTSNDFHITESGVAERMTFLQGGNVGIGTTSPNQKLTINQGNSVFGDATLRLNQSDLSEEVIYFGGTISAGNPINTQALGSYYGRVRVSVNGTFKWLALYN